MLDIQHKNWLTRSQNLVNRWDIMYDCVCGVIFQCDSKHRPDMNLNALTGIFNPTQKKYTDQHSAFAVSSL